MKRAFEGNLRTSIYSKAYKELIEEKLGRSFYSKSGKEFVREILVGAFIAKVARSFETITNLLKPTFSFKNIQLLPPMRAIMPYTTLIYLHIKL